MPSKKAKSNRPVVRRTSPTRCSAFFNDPFSCVSAGLDIRKTDVVAHFDATSYRRFNPAVPTRGEFMSIDGLRVEITVVKTNQDKSGRWPDNEWPRITVTGHYKPNPTGQPPPRLGGGSVAPGCWASESKGK